MLCNWHFGTGCHGAADAQRAFGYYARVLENQRAERFFQERVGADKTKAADTKYWLQRWIAIAESIGIGKKELLEDYYLDEFLAVMDAYAEMHKIEHEDNGIEVTAENW